MNYPPPISQYPVSGYVKDLRSTFDALVPYSVLYAITLMDFAPILALSEVKTNAKKIINGVIATSVATPLLILILLLIYTKTKSQYKSVKYYIFAIVIILFILAQFITVIIALVVGKPNLSNKIYGSLITKIILEFLAMGVTVVIVLKENSLK